MAKENQQQGQTLNQQIALLRDQLKVREEDIKAMITGMTVEQFFGLVARACIANPDLLRADRLSLIQAALDCANDGLKPDGREGAFVCFNTKVQENGKWIPITKAQWMPMIRGITKKILNVATVKSLKAEPIYSRDHFRRWSDDDGEHMEFEPARGDRGDLQSYFAAIWMKDSVVFVEEMTPSDIDKIRKVSRAADNENAPWKQWPEEMSKKTILKRLSKRVPLSAEVERVLSRDDEMFLQTLRDVTPEQERPKGIANRLNALADNRGMGNIDLGMPAAQSQPENRQQADQKQAAGKQGQPAQTRETPKEEAPPMDVEGAYDRGIADKAAGKVSLSLPREYKQDGNEALMDAWQRGYRGQERPGEGDNDDSNQNGE